MQLLLTAPIHVGLDDVFYSNSGQIYALNGRKAIKQPGDAP